MKFTSNFYTIIHNSHKHIDRLRLYITCNDNSPKVPHVACGDSFTYRGWMLWFVLQIYTAFPVNSSYNNSIGKHIIVEMALIVL